MRDLRRAGVPASVSSTAGTYNCNTIFYGLAHYIATERPALRGGFVHVPYLPEMADVYKRQAPRRMGRRLRQRDGVAGQADLSQAGRRAVRS